MVVLALSIGKTFEVATDKVELFEKNCKKHNGKQIVLERLKQHSKGDVVWDLKK